MTTADRLNAMPLGEVMFTQRAIRRFKRDPIPDDVLEDIMQATIRAPNGGNNQQWHFILVKDSEKREKLAELYHEAWWAKRADQGIMGPEDIPPGKSSMRSAMRMANEIGDAPVMVLVCATAKGAQAMGRSSPRRRICCWRRGPSVWAAPSPPCTRWWRSGYTPSSASPTTRRWFTVCRWATPGASSAPSSACR